jgi:SAM-dependent methyltransferase
MDMSHVVSNCPLCGGERHSFFERVIEGEREVAYHLCATCGMVFQSPRMTAEELDEFYQSEYRLLVQGHEGPSEKDRRVQAGRARHLVAFCKPYVTEVVSHLDIGSSAGSLMKAVKDAYGCTSLGVEPGDAYRKFSRERSLQTVTALSELGAERHASFDLISMSHMLEHIPDPIQYLQMIRRDWLTPNGYVLVEVPNLFGHQSYELAHLLAFSARTLKQTLQMAGFEICALKAHGNPRSRWIPLYITALARVDAGGQAEKNVRWRSNAVRLQRRLGMAWHRWVTRFLPGLAWLPFPPLDEM